MKEDSEWIDELNSWISDLSSTSLYLPAGNTPIPLYENWQSTHPDFLQGMRMIQIDDVITGKKQGLFKQFFRQYLPSYVHQFHWIDDEETQADMAILGLGLNGHVGFHEPHMPLDFSYGELELSDQSIATLGLESKARGLSYGLGHFMQCKAIALLVFGENKRSILDEIQKNDQLPAGHLLKHPNLKLFTDI